MTRHAQNTRVPVARSRAEIERVLERYEVEASWRRLGVAVRARWAHVPYPRRGARSDPLTTS